MFFQVHLYKEEQIIHKKKLPDLTLRFHGGTEEVTGSRHLLELGSSKIMLDCGLFQGHRHQAIEKNNTFPMDPEDLTAVLLSHSHIDHCGALPMLVKRGFTGAIHCSPPTADLLRIMLMDSAFLQEEDAKFFNKIHKGEGISIEPLYTQEDVEKTLTLVLPHQYDELFFVSDEFRAQFHNAGHVLGSAMIQVEANTPKGLRRILFTGDLGRRQSLIMTPPEIPKNVDYLLIDSTYGGRVHEPVSKVEKVLTKAIHMAAQEQGRILIPSFALERTQEVIYILEKLRRHGEIPPIELFVDSPMASEITKVFNANLDSFCFSEKFKKYVKKEGDPFGLQTVRYVQSVEESKRLNELPGQKIILAGSGMCEGGRILHHLRNYVDKASTSILLVGYQAKGTLGRRLWEGQKKVKIFGLRHEVHARIDMLENFSSHADQNDLLWFIQHLNPRPRKVFLVHGDTDQRETLHKWIKNNGINRVKIPNFGDEFKLL